MHLVTQDDTSGVFDFVPSKGREQRYTVFANLLPEFVCITISLHFLQGIVVGPLNMVLWRADMISKLFLVKTGQKLPVLPADMRLCRCRCNP